MRIAVVAEESGNEGSAERLAERLNLELFDPAAPPADTLLLAVTADGLLLREPGPRAAGPIRAEFRAGRGSSLLRRAVMAGKEGVQSMIDATAGLAQDAFAIAEAGLEVELIERSPVVAALLADGLERALEDSRCRAAAERMRLHVGEARELMPRLSPADVVYLDPMYPQSGREGGKGKEMRVLRLLLEDDPDADELLDLARRAATRRVTVKRPLRAAPLGGEEPSGSLKGTTIRYDLYGPAAKLSTVAG